MGEAGFERIRKSVTSRQNTVAQYIVMRPIMDLCGQSTRRPGVRVSWWWWDQAGMNLGGGKEKGVRGSNGFGVRFGIGLGCGPGRGGGVKWSERVKCIGVEGCRRATPLECKQEESAEGGNEVAKLT